MARRLAATDNVEVRFEQTEIFKQNATPHCKHRPSNCADWRRGATVGSATPVDRTSWGHVALNAQHVDKLLAEIDPECFCA